jgi:hypothetical protein
MPKTNWKKLWRKRSRQKNVRRRNAVFAREKGIPRVRVQRDSQMEETTASPPPPSEDEEAEEFLKLFLQMVGEPQETE